MIVAYYKSADADGAISKKKYWINRFARIYPVYLLALFLVGLYYWTIDRELFTSFGVRFPIEVVLLQSWIGKTSLNFPGWSLSVELFFYICFPFILLWISKYPSRKLIIGAIILYLVSQILYIRIYQRFGTDIKAQLAIDYFPVLNLGTFFLGAIIGMLVVRHLDIIYKYSKKVKFGGYALSLLSLLLIITLTDFQRFHHNGLFVPVYAFFLVGFISTSKLSHWLGNWIFVFLGDISYALYILQYPVWLFFRYVFRIEGTFTTVQFLGFIFTLILMSALVFKLYEQKMQYYIRFIFNKERA